jgi:hypothetical protein
MDNFSVVPLLHSVRDLTLALVAWVVKVTPVTYFTADSTGGLHGLSGFVRERERLFPHPTGIRTLNRLEGSLYEFMYVMN